MAKLAEITEQVNRHAAGRRIARLQELRKERLGLERTPSSTLFRKPRNPDWNFHWGGRTELQFNLGLEGDRGDTDFRYGVAFSFEPSQTLPDITPLLPLVERFNKYVRGHSDELAGLSMWYFEQGLGGGERSPDYEPAPIAKELVRPGVFVFLGSLGRSSAPDYVDVIDVFERLLPLYLFVEGHDDTVAALPVPRTFVFKTGIQTRPAQTVASVPGRKLPISLRHNVLQQVLYRELVEKFGAENVGTENAAIGGGFVDAVVRCDGVYEFYEIKHGPTARSCIREAVGQLLEYACWPSSPAVRKLVVVGEPSLTPETTAYLARLNERFPIELEYRQVHCG